MSTGDTTNYEPLWRYVKRITPIMLYKANLPTELADDVSQSAFLKFAKVSEERKRQITNKEAYLRSIIANVINDISNVRSWRSISMLRNQIIGF